MFPHGVFKVSARLFDDPLSRGNGQCNLRLFLRKQVLSDDAVGLQQGLCADETGYGSRHGNDTHQETEFSMADFTNYQSPDSHTLSRFNSCAA